MFTLYLPSFPPRLARDSQLKLPLALRIAASLREAGPQPRLGAIKAALEVDMPSVEFYHIKVAVALIVRQLLWFSGPPQQPPQQLPQQQGGVTVAGSGEEDSMDELDLEAIDAAVAAHQSTPPAGSASSAAAAAAAAISGPRSGGGGGGHVLGRQSQGMAKSPAAVEEVDSMDELDFEAIDAAVAVHRSTPPAASAGGSSTIAGGLIGGAVRPSSGPCGTATMAAALPCTLVGEASPWVFKSSGSMAASASIGGSSALPPGDGENREAAAAGGEKIQGGLLAHGHAAAAAAAAGSVAAGGTAAAEGLQHQEDGGSLGVKTVAGSKRPGGGLTAFGGAKRMPTSLM